MKKYQLANHLRFLNVETDPIPPTVIAQHQDLQRVQSQELYVLIDDTDDKTLLVNAIIYQFLQHFISPQSLAAATEQFAVQAGCPLDQIEPTVKQFFKAMRKRGILVRHILDDNNEGSDTENATLLTAGQCVGQYEIVDCIREKSRVVIYQAIRLTDGRVVALKMLKLPTDLSAKKRAKRIQLLQQEFALLHELQGHPNICEFLDLVVTNEYNYAVMEYLDGYSWGRFVKYEQPHLATRLKIAEQFVAAMAFIHQRGILHGDLHSGNIIIEAPHTVKIIDFDLANRSRPLKKEVLREGGVIHYIPPERISNTCFDTVKCAADFRSEVFQMGVILYRLFYEKMPFQGFTWRDLTQAIKTQAVQLAPTTPQGETIPLHIISLLKKALAKERNQRFADAQQMKSYLMLCAQSIFTT